MLRGLDLRERLAENLKVLRGKQTQSEFAEALGLPMRTYVNIELGHSWPQYANIQQMAEKLGVTEGQLFADPELVLKTPRQPPPTPAEALEIVKNALEKAEKRERELSLSARALSDILPTLDEDKARTILDFANRIRGNAGQAADKLKKPRSGA